MIFWLVTLDLKVLFESMTGLGHHPLAFSLETRASSKLDEG